MDKLISKNPATGEVLLEQVAFDTSRMSEVLRAARTVQETQWAPLSFKQRSVFLNRAKNYILTHIDEISRAISLNNGKPMVESIAAEVSAMVQTVQFATKHAARILRDEPVKIGMGLPTKRAYISHEPLGVIGIISPWNYPLSTPLAEVFLGLIAGNAIILKPSEVTGLVNVQIQKIVDSMQLPEHLFQMLHGGGAVGTALVKSGVDRIIFTGSVAVGKKVMAMASENLTPVTLELGGKDCMIVLEDADLDVASSGAVTGGFYNNGQTCCSVERLLVHEKIAAEFLKRMYQKTDKLRQGTSNSFDSDLGPITYENQKQVYFRQLGDHKAGHGETLHGSIDFDGKANFMKPLIVAGQETREFWKDETFGPVIAVKTFSNDQEAIHINNNSPFGLTALIFSKDNNRAQKLARKLRVGTVVINDAPFTNAVPSLPWGGLRDSGFGRVHGAMGLKELCRTKVITYDIFGQTKQFWWYPYSRAQYEFFKSFIQFLGVEGIVQKIKALLSVIRNLRKMGPRL